LHRFDHDTGAANERNQLVISVKNQADHLDWSLVGRGSCSLPFEVGLLPGEKTRRIADRAFFQSWPSDYFPAVGRLASENSPP
jgi:hypothetical protein